MNLLRTWKLKEANELLKWLIDHQYVSYGIAFNGFRYNALYHSCQQVVLESGNTSPDYNYVITLYFVCL
jgi:hypothetical protein